jgi:hypothetical protein
MPPPAAMKSGSGAPAELHDLDAATSAGLQIASSST